jgi:N-acyl-D-aspartate/D-glutamate deacylase
MLWPVSTMVRGRLVVRDGELVGRKDGIYLGGAKSPLAVPARRRIADI